VFGVGLEKRERPGTNKVRSFHAHQTKRQTGGREKLEEKFLSNLVNFSHLLEGTEEEASSGFGFKIRVPGFDFDNMGKKALFPQGEG
jgi:hypothetical protein